jgi:hypothetical protein
VGEKKILTDQMIDEKINALRPRDLITIDPMKMAEWSIETACAMVDNAVGPKTVERAIIAEELSATKTGQRITVDPQKFLVWYRRNRK